MNKKIIYGVLGAIVLGIVVYAIGADDAMVVENTLINEQMEDVSTTSVKTSGTVKKSTPSAQVSQPAKNMYVVTYTNKGFEPKEIQVPRGMTVKFVNKSSSAMRIFAGADMRPPFSDLNQPRALGANGEYTFNFVYSGIWSYYNSAKAEHVGNVVVY